MYGEMPLMHHRKAFIKIVTTEITNRSESVNTPLSKLCNAPTTKSNKVHGNRMITLLQNKLGCQIMTGRHINDQHLTVDRYRCLRYIYNHSVMMCSMPSKNLYITAALALNNILILWHYIIQIR